MESIVVCAVFQDAAAYILEWLAFHRIIGVDRFVLYDEGSTDGTAALIARSRFARQTTVIALPRGAEHAAFYNDFVTNHAAGSTWAAIIKAGDFLHPLAADSLRTLLPRYDGFSAVILRRLHFVVSGKFRPGQLVLGTCVDRVPETSLASAGMTLVRVSDIQGVQGSPPGFTLAGNVCDAGGTPVAPDEAQGRGDVLVVNRYCRFAERQETVPDRRIFRFVPRLRALLHDGVPAAPVASPAPALRPASPPAPRPPQAPPPLLGIGVISYNRCTLLNETLDLVQRHTRHPRTIVAVADDGSTDGTLDMLRARRTLTVTGRNMSIAWNKNRALFLLAELVRCDVVILIEDDTYPEDDNWESDWIQAAQRWGHISGLPRGIPERPVTGAGTLDDPFESEWLSAQCAVFSREAILFGGYFDTRFRGYGHEHVEHTFRLRRMGYGAATEHPGRFKSIWGGIGVRPVPSTFNAKDELAELNRKVAGELMGDLSYRGPWRTEAEAQQFRDEMRHAVPQAVR